MANDEKVGRTIADLFDSDPVVNHFLDQFEALIQLASAGIKVEYENEEMLPVIVSRLNSLSRELRFAVVDAGVGSISTNDRPRVLNGLGLVEKLSARFPAEDISSKLIRNILDRRDHLAELFAS